MIYEVNYGMIYLSDRGGIMLDISQVFILVGILIGVVLLLKLLKATVKFIVIASIIVLVAGYFGLDLVEVGRGVYDKVEEPAVELIEDGLNLDFWEDNGEESVIDNLQRPINALKDLGFEVNVTDNEVEFWEGDSFGGNLDVKDNQFSMEVDLSQPDNKETVLAIIEGLNKETVSKEVKDEMISAIERQEDEYISFQEGYLEIENDNLTIQINTTD